jgi:hypothetical protein
VNNPGRRGGVSAWFLCIPSSGPSRPLQSAHTPGKITQKHNEIDMRDSLGFGVTFVALVCVGVGSTSGGASAITAEVARKCDVLTMHAFPPRVVGNPAAGSTKGNGLAEQSYFRECVAHGGNIPGHVRQKRAK